MSIGATWIVFFIIFKAKGHFSPNLTLLLPFLLTVDGTRAVHPSTPQSSDPQHDVPARFRACNRLIHGSLLEPQDIEYRRGSAETFELQLP